MKDYILSLLENLKPQKIMVVGDMILDEFIEGEVHRISREAPIPIILQKKQNFVPGGGANAAANIASLGGKVFAVGVVGDDINSNNLKEVLNKRSIDTSGIFVEPGRITTTKTRISASSVQSVMQQVARLDKIPEGIISRNTINKIKKFIKDKSQEVRALLISDYENGVVVPEIIEICVEEFLSKSKPIIVDSQSNLIQFKNVTVLTPNIPEVERTLGYPIKDKETLEKAGFYLLEKTKAEAIIITRGGEGMVLFEKKNNNITYIPAFNKDEVYDVTGAGDTVVGTLTLGLSNGLNLKDAMILANIAAGIVVKKFGTATTSLEEIKLVITN